MNLNEKKYMHTLTSRLVRETEGVRLDRSMIGLSFKCKNCSTMANAYCVASEAYGAHKNPLYVKNDASKRGAKQDLVRVRLHVVAEHDDKDV